MRSCTGEVVGAQHVHAGTIGDDLDVNILILGAVMLDHIGRVVQGHVHDLRIVLVDLDGDAVRLAVGGKGRCGKRNGRQHGGGTAAKHEVSCEDVRTLVIPGSRGARP
jgi:hypothetical protein